MGTVPCALRRFKTRPSLVWNSLEEMVRVGNTCVRGVGAFALETVATAPQLESGALHSRMEKLANLALAIISGLACCCRPKQRAEKQTAPRPHWKAAAPGSASNHRAP